MSIRGYFFRTKRLSPRPCVIRYRVARRNARESSAAGGIVLTMAYIVTESCIKCKYTDCVDVCPVDCFREGPNMLVIDPEECIDCTLCVPECPVEAIFAEANVPAQWTHYTPMNAEKSAELKETGHITEKGDAKEGPGCKKK